MATLTEDTARTYVLGEQNDVPVIASEIIYEGSAVGDNASGYARPLVAADPFLGFAIDKTDNSSGSAGDKSARVKKRGNIVLSVTGVTGVSDINDTVYASDDNTFTLTSTSNTAIGKITRYVTGTIVEVEFEALSSQSI